jgi:hypothetical protein
MRDRQQVYLWVKKISPPPNAGARDFTFSPLSRAQYIVTSGPTHSILCNGVPLSRLPVSEQQLHLRLL